MNTPSSSQQDREEHPQRPVLGVDFDNTIVCYDQLFHRVALERGLIPADLPVNKSDVRNHLRRIGREDDWTEMQGYVYGARMAEAAAYPGAMEFFAAARRAGLPFRIISHKTRHPFRGEAYDLHAAATGWLEQQGFFNSAGFSLARENAFFELTKADKLKRIGLCGCRWFIDDLPEFLAEADFPAGVERILFDPNDLYRDETRFRRVTSWAELSAMLITSLKASTQAVETVLPERLARFVSQVAAGGEWSAEPVRGGANNRVYHIRATAADWLLKSYFQAPGDPRDRFGAERAFHTLIQEGRIQYSPHPVAWESEERLGLFEFIPGRKLATGEVSAAHVEEALQFVAELQAARKQPTAAAIQPASEACFSLEKHLYCVDRRIARLVAVAEQAGMEDGFGQFVRDELQPGWQRLRELTVQGAGSTFAEELAVEHRCLSPSDFGFHNALLRPDGRLCFFDFEYAGWDDPAKMVCDFFWQPQMPVPPGLLGGFAKRVSQLTGDPSLPARARSLLPVYRMKWACIMLNEFLREGEERRQFAAGLTMPGAVRLGQLEKAQRLLEDGGRLATLLHSME